MVFAEASARLILVLHTIASVACVGAATHLVLWLRPYRRGSFPRARAVRRFAWLSVALYAAAFIGGNLIYPTYKVRVRAQYLEDPSAVTRDAARQKEAARRVERLFGAPQPMAPEEPALAPPTEKPAQTTAKIARWFDTKEHWVALGFALALAVAFMLAAWKPTQETKALGPVVFWLAFSSAASAWFAAIVGVVVSSFRAVGSL